ncbi:MAG: hypothetical protein PHH13_05460 [Candidatus Peribacteraceae bacterium]|nr:hypothetical protein [Candidatus Peribacteraceae bacterium]
MEFQMKTDLGRFAFAEPNYGGTWTVFRIHENGRGPDALSAELIDAQGAVIQQATFPYFQGRERIRANQMQAENALRKTLGLL